MKLLKAFACCLLLACLTACEERVTEINTVTAKELYDKATGTYVGNIMVDNQPRAVSVTIGNDFTVTSLPTKPILKEVFTDNTALAEALASAAEATFKAPTDNMSVLGNNVLLTMVTSDLVFPVTVGGRTENVEASIAPYAEVNTLSNELSLHMEVKALYYDGHAYDMSDKRITYSIDIANKIIQ